MKKIFMLQSEIVGTKTGSVVYEKGETVEVENWIASSLVGRGLAEFVEEGKKSLSVSELQVMTVVQLRKLGQAAKVPKYNSINKDLLVAALAPKEAPAESFQVIENNALK